MIRVPLGALSRQCGSIGAKFLGRSSPLIGVALRSVHYDWRMTLAGVYPLETAKEARRLTRGSQIITILDHDARIVDVIPANERERVEKALVTENIPYQIPGWPTVETPGESDEGDIVAILCKEQYGKDIFSGVHWPPDNISISLSLPHFWWCIAIKMIFARTVGYPLMGIYLRDTKLEWEKEFVKAHMFPNIETARATSVSKCCSLSLYDLHHRKKVSW